MLCNIGKVDRLIRITLGASLISMVYIGPQTPWGWLGLIPLITSVLCFCPIYGVIGMNTIPKEPLDKS